LLESEATPTTSIGGKLGSILRTLLPTASSPGQSWRATLSLTIATSGASRVSCASKARPARSGTPKFASASGSMLCRKIWT
jgi:hypothetical protein